MFGSRFLPSLSLFFFLTNSGFSVDIQECCCEHWSEVEALFKKEIKFGTKEQLSKERVLFVTDVDEVLIKDPSFAFSPTSQCIPSRGRNLFRECGNDFIPNSSATWSLIVRRDQKKVLVEPEIPQIIDGFKKDADVIALTASGGSYCEILGTSGFDFRVRELARLGITFSLSDESLLADLGIASSLFDYPLFFLDKNEAEDANENPFFTKGMIFSLAWGKGPCLSETLRILKKENTYKKIFFIDDRKGNLKSVMGQFLLDEHLWSDNVSVTLIHFKHQDLRMYYNGHNQGAPKLSEETINLYEKVFNLQFKTLFDEEYWMSDEEALAVIKMKDSPPFSPQFPVFDDDDDIISPLDISKNSPESVPLISRPSASETE